jgi:PAS domain S-box-containing protein
MKRSTAATELLESLGYAYFEVDLAGRLLYANKIFLDSLGYTEQELLGKHFRHYVDREQVAPMFDIFSMIHKTGVVEKRLPMGFVHKDGSSHRAEGSIALIRDEQGNPTGFHGILLDITETHKHQTTIARLKKRAEKELEIAREIQFSFLVKDYPQPEGWEIAAYIRPAREVGGDFYDVFPLTSSSHIALVLADVCDKGVGAAMYMAIFRSLFRAYSEQQDTLRPAGATSGQQDARLAAAAPSLQNAIDLTNRYIATQHGNSNMFATVFFGLLDPDSGDFAYINAGHEPPLLISEGKAVRRLDPTGPAVGMLPDMEFRMEMLRLDPGDSLVVYTDGITDARSPEQEAFSEPRLVEAAISPTASAQRRIQNIMTALDKHIADREQYDDVTLLVAQRKSES